MKTNKIIVCLLAMFMMCLATEVQAQNKVPTFKEVSDNYWKTTTTLSKYGIKLLKKDLYEYDGDEVGSIYVGKNAKIVEKNYENKIIPTGDHAIVIVSCQGAEASNLDIYFSNKEDYNAFLKTCKNTGYWHLRGKNMVGKLYHVYFDDAI